MSQKVIPKRYLKFSFEFDCSLEFRKKKILFSFINFFNFFSKNGHSQGTASPYSVSIDSKIPIPASVETPEHYAIPFQYAIPFEFEIPPQISSPPNSTVQKRQARVKNLTSSRG